MTKTLQANASPAAKIKKLLTNDYYGLPIWLIGITLIIIYAITYAQILPSENMLTIITVMFSVGFLLYEIGEHLPIWKDYIGGGAVMAFFGAATLNYFGILPKQYADNITYFYDDFGFQTVFISLLIVSAVLTVNRKQLIAAFKGYVPAILGGILMATVFGVMGAIICKIDLMKIATIYVLPIMGGGNGAGAIPLSEMWEKTTGQSKESYYSMAFAILNIANNFAILGAVALNALGEKFPKLTGNGELLKDPSRYQMAEDHIEKPVVGPYQMAGGLLLTGGVYAVSRLFSSTILPSIGPVSLHMYAYMVIFSALINVGNFVPAAAKQGAKRLSAFFTKPLMCMCMFGIGIAFTDLGDFIAVLNFKTLFICLLIVIGAIIGSGFVGTLFGFNFVESAITAGLCMSNRGGSGDLQVLGAGKRMNLMSYAQISSRIGGAIILLVASIVFSFVK